MVGISARRLVLAVLVVISVLLLPVKPAAAGLDLLRRLPLGTSHVALYWQGDPGARVRLALGNSTLLDAGRDELGAQRNDGITYGAVRRTLGATTLRVLSDRPLAGLKIALLESSHRGGLPLLKQQRVGRPAIISRANWSADESLRFNGGTEKWKPTFFPLQKLIVHHTDTANADPNPAATVRAIYRYHAVTQGWGDIGYNFLIDEAGRIYKGRHSHAPGQTADTISGENAAGHGVAAAHAAGFNSGTVGVALLGTLTNKDATPAAKRALESLLAWKAGKHNINPTGKARYTNPSTGAQATFPNIAGHRDVNTTTECPGNTFYKQLPGIRSRVALRVG